MSLKKYETARQLNKMHRFGEIILIVLLLIRVARDVTVEDIGYFISLFLFSVIVIVVGIIAYIVEVKALKEIEEIIAKWKVW